MANTSGSHNQPSHEAQVKGGQHSHSGGSSSSPNQGSASSTSGQNNPIKPTSGNR